MAGRTVESGRLKSLLADYATGAGVLLKGGELGWEGQGSRVEMEKQVREALRTSFQENGSAGLAVKQSQLTLTSDSSPVNLAWAPILVRTRGEGMIARDRRFKNLLGWAFAISTKPLPSKIEALLLAAAAHLGGIATLARLESEIAMRDQFLSIASHELKTPLTSIYGVIQLQERMLRPKKEQTISPDQEKQRSFFKIVIRQVERLNELIDGLLDVSRIQNGRFMVEPANIDTALVLKETVQNRLSILAQEAGVRIQIDSEPHVLAYVDPVRFEEVVTNLGMNAIRFSPEGGVVWIKLKQEGDQTVLSVRDQGPAVPEIDRERIFQPFERASRTGRMGGLGLGLFISRQIAELHGGSVVLAESLPGKGNLFVAKFPRRLIELKTA